MPFGIETAFSLRNFAPELRALCGLAGVFTAKVAKDSQRAAKEVQSPAFRLLVLDAS
jgi:hypothetical protein